MESREVIVVGGGPAGATAARLLALAGADVLLLESSALPRTKACGDCLSPETGRLLGRLGLGELTTAFDHARLAGWRIVAHDGSEMRASFADIGDGDERITTAIAAPRALLDMALVDAARRAGVEVRTDTRVLDVNIARTGPALRVRAPAGEQRMRARLLIGADGLRSIVARRLALVRRPPRLRKVSLSAHVRNVRRMGAFGELHLEAGCCVGIAPVNRSASICNLTIVLASGSALERDATRSRDERLSHVARNVLARMPRLRGRCDEMELVHDPALTHVWMTSGPFDVPVRRVLEEGVALAGDAAGYYDPFTGQGIYQAMASAERLADVAATALRRAGPVSSASLGGYAAAHARLVRGPRRVQHLVEWVTSRGAIAPRAIRMLARNASLRSTLLGVTGDVLPASALLQPRYALHAVHALVRNP